MVIRRYESRGLCQCFPAKHSFAQFDAAPIRRWTYGSVLRRPGAWLAWSGCRWARSVSASCIPRGYSRGQFGGDEIFGRIQAIPGRFIDHAQESLAGPSRFLPRSGYLSEPRVARLCELPWVGRRADTLPRRGCLTSIPNVTLIPRNA